MAMTFETKDSGKREQFTSGMVRDTQEGKTRFDLAFDGPLFWELFAGTKKEGVARAAGRWYADGGLANAAAVVQELAKLEGGLFAVVERYAGLMTRGAAKYAEKNWMKANGEPELKRFIISFGHHLKQYLNDELDEDHMAALFFNMNGAEYVRAKLKAA